MVVAGGTDSGGGKVKTGPAKSGPLVESSGFSVSSSGSDFVSKAKLILLFFYRSNIFPVSKYLTACLSEMFMGKHDYFSDASIMMI